MRLREIRGGPGDGDVIEALPQVGAAVGIRDGKPHGVHAGIRVAVDGMLLGAAVAIAKCPVPAHQGAVGGGAVGEGDRSPGTGGPQLLVFSFFLG